MMKKITFVCLGNICRSPMAEYLAKEYCKKNSIMNIKIDSCGTAGYHDGEFMHEGTHRLLTKLNIKHNDFRSKKINTKIFQESDFIFVMDDNNLKDLEQIYGKNKKMQKITNFTNLKYQNVPDPWYSGNFEEVFEILDDCIKNIFMKIL